MSLKFGAIFAAKKNVHAAISYREKEVRLPSCVRKFVVAEPTSHDLWIDVKHIS